MIKFLRNTKPPEKPESSDISVSFSSILEDDAKPPGRVSSTKKVTETCAVIPETLMKFTCEMTDIKLAMLLQQYHMDMFRIDSSFLKILYETKYDHMIFETSFKDLILFDLTGYPYTISPKEFL